jgi:anti-sigma factor RsiW
MSSDRHAHWDAAYVLGALSAAERQEYEDHLTRCPSCRDAVAELAGMPGLLARVPTGEVLAMGQLEGELMAAQPPPSLMPVLPPEHRRWGQHVLVPAVAAAALVVGGLGGYALSEGQGTTVGPPAATSTTGPVRVAFSPVSESSMTAVLDIVPQGAETQLRVECQYALKMPDGSAADGAWSEYAIWVVDREGRAVLQKAWSAKPDRVMRPTAASPLAPDDIAAVEIRRVDTGETVLRAGLG